MGAGMMGKDDLDAVFAAARADGPVPSADLFARVLADAAALQPQPAQPSRPQPRRGFLAALAAVFGGGPVLAGMCSAVMAGLFVGLVQPAPVLTPVLALTAMLDGNAFATTTALDVSTGIDALISEE